MVTGWRGAIRPVHVGRITAKNLVRRNLGDFRSCSPLELNLPIQEGTNHRR